MRVGVEAAVVGGVLLPGDVEVADGRVAAVGLSPPGRGIAVPGFVDLQVNGFDGVDFRDADARAWSQAVAALRETGVTSFLPTLVTAPEAELVAALRSAPPGVLGFHLEGPFLSPHRLGVHDPAARRDPDRRLLGRLLDAGPVRLVTLAPELPGALELVDELRARAIAVSLGHTDASAEEAHAAFDRGVACVTHVFNAMRPLHHRDPGVVGAALARDDVVVCVIADGVHLAPDAVRLVARAARGRFALVTDAVAGETRRPDGVLTGGGASMIEAVRNLHALGVSLEEAVGAATATPARVLGEAGLGRLAVGLPADVAVLDDRLEIVRVL